MSAHSRWAPSQPLGPPSERGSAGSWAWKPVPDPVNTYRRKETQIVEPGRFLIGKKHQVPWKELSMRFFVASETTQCCMG